MAATRLQIEAATEKARTECDDLQIRLGQTKEESVLYRERAEKAEVDMNALTVSHVIR